MRTIIIMAESLDGSIAYDSGHTANWTSKEDKQFFVSETKKAGVIIFGKKTFDTFGGKPLPNRLNLVLTRDQKNAMEAKENLLEFSVNESPKDILARLEKRGFEKVFIGGGSAINGLFLDSKLVDELWITVEPKIFGTGMRIFSDKKRDIDLELKSVDKANQSVILKYGVKYGSVD